MYFHTLHDRLIAHLRDRVRSGNLTERGLARVTGVSQPHIHNVLKGKRLLSAGKADAILSHLHLNVLDLVKPEDLLGWRGRR